MPKTGTDNMILLELPANYKYLNIIGACIAAILEREEDLQEQEILRASLELAIHEACTNIVEHAYSGISGRIKLVLVILDDPRRLEVKIHDTGKSFSFDAIKIPNVEEVQVRGYGLFLIHQLVDEVNYLPGLKDNMWRLVKNL
jgi:serine/threonine-protein kinase RsbW